MTWKKIGFDLPSLQLILELQQIADPDVERQQEWGKVGNVAL